MLMQILMQENIVIAPAVVVAEMIALVNLWGIDEADQDQLNPSEMERTPSFVLRIRKLTNPHHLPQFDRIKNFYYKTLFKYGTQTPK